MVKLDTWLPVKAATSRSSMAVICSVNMTDTSSSVMLANTPAMLECHYGVPMMGAVLNTLNTRLDAAILAFTLDHAETRALVIDREFSGVMRAALELARRWMCEVPVAKRAGNFNIALDRVDAAIAKAEGRT